jgi:hypothetical protein
MPALSGQFNPGIGPLINIGVLPAGLLTPTTAQTMQVTAFPALLDTGASMTCVSPNGFCCKNQKVRFLTTVTL